MGPNQESDAPPAWTVPWSDCMARRSGASRSGVLAMIMGATSTSTISNVEPMTNRLNQLRFLGR